MSTVQTRRFAAFDAATLLAATSLGVAWAMTSGRLLFVLAGDELGDRLLVNQALHVLAAFAAVPTIALAVLSFRQPRPSLSSSLRHPGAVACLVAAIFLGVEVVNHFLDLPTRFYEVFLLVNSAWVISFGRIMPGVTRLDSVAFSLGATPGLAVAGAYLALWSAGRWRSESSWIDRAGRALGWFWIALAAALIVLTPWAN